MDEDQRQPTRATQVKEAARRFPATLAASREVGSTFERLALTETQKSELAKAIQNLVEVQAVELGKYYERQWKCDRPRVAAILASIINQSAVRLSDYLPQDPECCAGCGARGTNRETILEGEVALHWQVRGAWVCVECYNKASRRDRKRVRR